MTTIFNWKHDAKPTGAVDLALLVAKFGDGYEQTAADGINTKSQSWPLTFTGFSSKIAPIRDFLDACAGYQSFYWTPPLGVQGLYKASTYNLQHLGGDVYALTATFKQSFQP